MNLTIISDNIAWDGTHFCCRRCGRSGYKSMAAIKGHLAMCPGKAIQKGAVQPIAASYSSAATVSIGDLGSSPASQLASAAVPDSSQLENERRLAALENEYQHMLLANNAKSSDWLSENKGILILLGGTLLFIVLVRESSDSSSCPPCLPCKGNTSENRTRSRSNNKGHPRLGSNNIGSILATRAVTKIVDKGLDKFLK